MSSHYLQSKQKQPIYSHPDLTPRINLLSTKAPRSNSARRHREPPSRQNAHGSLSRATNQAPRYQPKINDMNSIQKSSIQPSLPSSPTLGHKYQSIYDEPQKRDLYKVGSRLIYWESPIHSLLVLAGLLLLVCWSPQHFILSTFCWIISLDLVIVQAVRILHKIVFCLPSDTAPHPFQTLLRVSDQVSLSRPSSSTWAGMASTEMHKIVLVQDKKKSLMWLGGTMSYLAISAWVPTRTLLILACISLFSVPKIMLDIQNAS